MNPDDGIELKLVLEKTEVVDRKKASNDNISNATNDNIPKVSNDNISGLKAAHVVKALGKAEVTGRKMKSEFEYSEEEEEDDFHPNNEPCRHLLDIYQRKWQQIKLPKSNPPESPVIHEKFEWEESFQQWMAGYDSREEYENNDEEEGRRRLEKSIEELEELQKEMKDDFDELLKRI